MIQVQSRLNVADNSGAKNVLCIKILGSSGIRYANIGDIIKVSIKKCIPKSKVKKGEMYKALIVRTIYGVKRKDFSYLKFSDNAVVILNNKLELLGSRILGPIAREIKFNFPKLISLAKEVY